MRGQFCRGEYICSYEEGILLCRRFIDKDDIMSQLYISRQIYQEEQKKKKNPLTTASV